MKLKKQYCLLLSMVSFLSACSTTTQNTDTASVATSNADQTQTAETIASPSVNAIQTVNTNEDSSQVIHSKNEEISRLKQTLANNQNQISNLDNELNLQEEKISALEAATKNAKAARLIEIEEEKAKLAQLEAQYIKLKLENEQLKQSLVNATSQNKLLKEQILRHELMTADDADFIPVEIDKPEPNESVADVTQDLSIIGLQEDYNVLNKMHHALLHKYANLDENYQTLDGQYLSQQDELNQLKAQYKTLARANQKSKTDYAALKQKNLDLGGAISDARAQQQSLWDQIQVKEKVIKSLEADNSALREKSATLSNLTSGNITSTLPVSDNALELGTLNAKILVLESEIEAQQKLLSEYQEKLTELEQSDDKSDLKNIEIARLGQELTDLNHKYDELNYQFEQLELAQAVSREQQHELLQELTLAKANLAKLTTDKLALENEITQAQTELVSLQGRYEESLLALESAKETRQSLETQLSDLIELEAISAGFSNQLITSLTNVRWQIPKQVELGTSFEIILSADVNDALAGQVFIAELITDSSLELVSSISAEAQTSEGQLQWRWRAKGASESQVAQVNLFIHQDIQYQEERVLREVYRDQKVLSLVNDNLFEKYGFWVIAIFAGLMGGFLIGKLNKSQSANV